VPKSDTDYMVISNEEALRQQTLAEMIAGTDPAGSAAASAMAREVMQSELNQYLSGQKFTIPVTPDTTWSMQDLGSPL
jgi:hypothetical protein